MSAPAARPAWFDVTPGPDVLTDPLDRATRADVVVVGLGASGLAACAHLAARGADVVGVDRAGIAAGAAGANGGFLLAGLAMFHHDAVQRLGRARAAAAYRWTLDLLDRQFDIEPTARRTGSLRLAGDDEEIDDIAAQRAALRADGFDAEAHEGPEGVGLLVPTDGVVHPVARCRRLAEQARAAGARLHAPDEVVALDDGGVTLRGGTTVTARAVVVAVDGGLERLVDGCGARTARLQMLATGPEPDLDRPRPQYRRWGYDYTQQLPTGQFLIGGGRDAGGPGEWGAPPVVSEPVQDHLDAERARLGVTAPVTHRWAALAAFTDDLLPVAMTVDGTVHVVGGYSGHGNLLGPALAVLAADAALDGGEVRLPF